MAVGARLEDYFDGAAGKYLSAVETDPTRSNQHEFNGVTPLAGLLGQPPSGGRVFSASYVYLDDEDEPLVVDGTATWYDARERHPTRTEYRFYYPGNEVMMRAAAGDYLVVACSTADVANELLIVVAASGSTRADQLMVMFGLEPAERFDVETTPSGTDLAFTTRELLEALGYEVEIADDSLLDPMLKRFGSAFPQTKVFSQFARESIGDLDAENDPDGTLLEWWDREEVLFRTFERHLLSQQIVAARDDIDEILRVAMSTFQRRKSRAGHALENQVEELLRVWKIPYTAQPRTEGKVRPDFIVPGEAAYHDPTFDVGRLRLLAVKSTCKDRWRQVLSEAARIPLKHLLTLEAPISQAQTDEMCSNAIRLVVPSPLHGSFLPSQSVESVMGFLTEAKAVSPAL